ncbi:MAG: caspase family protein [Acidobacteriota bacterium]
MSEPGAARLHALLIGIDAYEPPADGCNEPAYPPLEGCVHDALQVRDLLTFWGVREDRIELLVAPHGPLPRHAEQPTHARLLEALRGLVERTRPGDQVWIHYSGHGGRGASRFERVKGPGAHDEALVPVDIARPTAGYVRDLEIAWLLAELTDGGRLVTVVLDSCHSGGMRRDDLPRAPAPRARHNTVRLRRLEAPMLQPLDVLLESYATRSRPPAQPVRLGAAPLIAAAPSRLVVLAACAPYQRAFEATLGGIRTGLFSHALVEKLAADGPRLSYQACHAAVRADFHRLWGSAQTPQIEGDPQRAILGSARGSDAATTPRVLFAGPSGIRLTVGQIHGVRPGHHFAVAGGGSSARRHRELRVVDVEATESRAVPVGTASIDALHALAPGTRVELVCRGTERAPIGLRSTQPGTRINRRLRLLWRALRDLVDTRHASAELVCSDDGGLLEVGADGEGRLRLIEPSRGALSLPSTPSLDTLDAPRLLEILEHVVRFRRLEELEVASHFDTALHVGLRLPSRQSLERHVALCAGDSAELVVEHRGGQRMHRGTAPVGVLQVAVMVLSEDWCIRQLVPSLQDTLPLEPGGALVRTINACSPIGRDRLKVLVTRDSVSHRWLEQPGLHRRAVRSADTRSASAPAHDWAVFDLTIRVLDSLGAAGDEDSQQHGVDASSSSSI